MLRVVSIIHEGEGQH